MPRNVLITSLLLFGATAFAQTTAPVAQRPNVVLIYADDLGYGDLSCYAPAGATKVKTPSVDRLAAQGLRFKNAYATAATCTPSRYSLLTGEYAWRRKGTGIAPGNASLIIEPGRSTLPGVFKQAGYQTAVVGKWHLGLGGPEGPNWNGELKPGPLELGFTQSYIMAATGDRVPCVYVENHRVVNLDPNDPIQVSYDKKIGNWPTGRDNPELLKMKHSHGHDMTIVNGVGRIGYMTGGKAALWKDEDMADVFTKQAVSFIENSQKNGPFFLYFATHNIHVPRVPHPRFRGKSGMGPRGDALLEFDWQVGEIMKTLDRLGLADNTMVILSSDNGPVVDDGYQDQAVEKLNGHKPAGPLRGGKYSAFEAGTRVPLLVRWPGQVKKGVSSAPVSQVDFLADFAALLNAPRPEDAVDSENQLNALLGRDRVGRSVVVQHAGTWGIVQGNWKYIEPGDRPAYEKYTATELGNHPKPQLYNLGSDLGERQNVADQYPERVEQLKQQLEKIKNKAVQ